jgi:N-acetylmuramoyl-L-alanine amidase
MYANRGGHNYKIKGASDLLDEVTEDRNILASVNKYLKQLGEDVIDVSPNETNTKLDDLEYGVLKANNANAKLFTSIHLNASERRDTASGSEILLNPNNKEAVTIANRILDNLESLGFENRGLVDGIKKGLYETRHTNMTAILVECFFLNSSKDVELYNKVGVDAIGKAIAEGITGKKVSNNSPMLRKVIHDTVAMGIDKNGLIYPVKEFRNGDNITIGRIVNQLGELDINGVKAYITVGYTTNR